MRGLAVAALVFPELAATYPSSDDHFPNPAADLRASDVVAATIAQ
jgi:predicted amidohydrolase